MKSMSKLKRHSSVNNKINNTADLRRAVAVWLSDEPLAIETYGHISTWDVSNVTDMSTIFKGASSFNEPLDNWNVSNVTDMLFMFDGARSFNRDISNWDIHANTTTDRMFIKNTSVNDNKRVIYNTSENEDFQPSYKKTVIRRKQKITDDRYKAMSALTQINNSTPDKQKLLPPDIRRLVAEYVAGKKKKQKKKTKKKQSKKATKKKKKQTTKKKLSV
jgi:surface protein